MPTLARNVAWVQGWTQPRYFRLSIDGTYPDLTDREFELVLTDRNGANVAEPGTLEIVTPQEGANLGRIRYTPASASILTSARSPLSARFKETGPAGDRFWPASSKGGAMRWYVSPVAG